MATRLPNLNAPLVNRNGILINPWNIFFQLFFGTPQPVIVPTITVSPYSFTASQAGTMYVNGGTVSNISLIRGGVTIFIASSTNAVVARSFPMSTGDIVTVTYTVAPTMQFVPT